MTDWLQAEYRDFDDRPRAMLCTGARGTYYFLSRTLDGRSERSDCYEVYRLPAPREGEACQSWFGLEIRALERLPDIPVREFPFDLGARRFLPYHPIAAILGE